MCLWACLWRSLLTNIVGSGKTCPLVSLDWKTRRYPRRKGAGGQNTSLLSAPDEMECHQLLQASAVLTLLPTPLLTKPWSCEPIQMLSPLSCHFLFQGIYSKLLEKELRYLVQTEMQMQNLKNNHLCVGLACSLDALKDEYERSWIRLGLYSEFRGSVRLQHETGSEKKQ